MKLLIAGSHIEVRLSRKNLEVLLQKLNGTPPGSQKTLVKQLSGKTLWVIAEEDNEHYEADENPGSMHPSNESILASARGKEGKGRD